MTARSFSASYTTSCPRRRLPLPDSTNTASVPATTCALVSTCCGAYTNPEPSIRREQDGAVPRSCTTGRRAWVTTAEPATAGSGAGTCRTWVGSRSPNTLGNPLVSTVRRSDSDSALASLGITVLITCSSALLRTARDSPGIGEEPSGAATNQATSSTAMMETTEPPRSSRLRPTGLRIEERSRAPSQLANACPPIAMTSTVSSETNTRATPSVKKSAKNGPSCRPIAAPPKNPTNDSRPVRKPWRYPFTAKTMTGTTRTTSTRLPYIRSGYGPIASDGQLDPGRVLPRSGPAGQVQQYGEDPGGEAPDEHRPDPERRTDVPAGMAYPQPVRRVDQLRHRYPGHPGHLGRLHRRDRMRAAPPGEYRRHQEPAHRDPQRRQFGEHAYRLPAQPDLLGRLAQGGIRGVRVPRIGRTAGEGRLPRVVAQLRGPLEQQYVGPVRRLAEQDQYGAGPAPLGRYRDPGEVLPPCPRDRAEQRLPPVRQLVRHAATPRCAWASRSIAGSSRGVEL